MRARRLPSIAVVLALAGCAGQLGMPSEQELLVEAGDGRVFGRFELLQNGQAPDRGSVLFPKPLSLVIVRTGASDEVPGNTYPVGGVADDGRFDWRMKRGDYLILGYALSRGGGSAASGVSTGRIMGSFSVPRGGARVYIGDLRVESSGAVQRAQVIDRYDETLTRVDPAWKGAAEKRLMVLERPPGTYARIAGICDPFWQLVCDEDYRGVRPLKPEGAVRGFPTTENLQPLLEWTPSPRAGVTYDIAIYESFSRGLLRGGSFGGPLVMYAQGLGEPRYLPPTPLAPGKRYEWTVRLRDGESVSTWSATNYAWLIAAPGMVVGDKGSGRIFAFETPGK